MKIKCEYCESWINDYDRVCKNCGGTNSHFKRQADGVPATIEELKQWAYAKNIPLDDMRTYIGINMKTARAFGIYQDKETGNFILLEVIRMKWSPIRMMMTGIAIGILPGTVVIAGIPLGMTGIVIGNLWSYN